MPDGAESVMTSLKRRSLHANHEGMVKVHWREELRPLLAAVEAARGFLEDEMLGHKLDEALATLYDTPAAATAASSEEAP